MSKTRVVVYGLGPIGAKMVNFLHERGTFEIAGGVDIAPDKVGKDLGEIGGLGKKTGVVVESNGRALLERIKPDAVVLTTTSILERIKPQVEEILESGAAVVSTCEELTFPWKTNPGIARDIDALAKRKNVAVLATGVNPGFLMDLLPLVATGVCKKVEDITVYRIQDATSRRIPFQKKVGVGIDVKEFNDRVEKKTLRHVGLTESMHMIASRMGWDLERTQDIIEPVIADENFSLQGRTIEKGYVLGVQQTGKGFAAGRQVLTLVFKAAAGISESYDRIVVNGLPPIDMTIKNGVNGDIATCAMVMNAIPAVLRAKPGLRTMADIEPVACFS